MLLTFGLATVAIAAPGNTVKGLVTAGLGVLLSVIGYDPITGVLRFGFGSSNYLWDGINLPAFFVGVFAVGEVIGYYVRGGTIARAGMKMQGIWKGTLEEFREFFRHVRSRSRGRSSARSSASCPAWEARCPTSSPTRSRCRPPGILRLTAKTTRRG